MFKPDNYLTAREFAKTAGVSSTTVSKWLREGIISGMKRSGKWCIPPGELAKVIKSEKNSQEQSPSSSRESNPAPSKTTATGRSFSIREFSDMTYLTEFGVQKWLKEGRLKKIVVADGQLKVDSSSLEDPYVKRLLR